MVLAACTVPVVLGLLLFGLAYQKFGEIPRAPVKSVLSTGGTGTNWLIVGTDSREGFEDAVEVAGSRTDSIMVLRVADGETTLLSIPRDLWVTDPATGGNGRINGTFNAGPANLVAAVQSIGIPVHRYLEINFVGFAGLVDAVGGIDVHFPHPARDNGSGLDQPEAGVQTLDGEQALAFVRARFYEELKDGEWVRDPLSDLSRVERQRVFLTALLDKVTGIRNPLAVLSVTGAMAGGLRLDDGLSFVGAIRFALALRGFAPESTTLPVTNATRGGAQVLDIDEAAAAPILAAYAS